MPKFASRIQGVGLSVIRQIMLKASGCVNLGIGEPDFFAPEIIRQEAHRVLDQEKIGYSATLGIPELCAQVRRYHGDHPDHLVCITNGSQEALFDTLLALLDAGDEVLVPNPGFMAYPTIAQLAGATAVPYPLHRAKGFRLAEGAIENLLSSRTRVIVLNSPSNPTGQCFSRHQLGAIAELARERDVVVVSDEVYQEVHYLDQKPASIADVSDRAVILSSASKMASMTGWRVGWACGPQSIIEKVGVMHQYTSSCASTLSQKAALQAFTAEGKRAIEEQRKLLQQTRDFLCSWIEDKLDRPYVPPQGAIYLMLSIEDLGMESLAVCDELLNDGVATIPGSAFGSEGEGFIRLSFACEPAQLEAGLERLKKGVGRLLRKTRVWRTEKQKT